MTESVFAEEEIGRPDYKTSINLSVMQLVTVMLEYLRLIPCCKLCVSAQ